MGSTAEGTYAHANACKTTRAGCTPSEFRFPVSRLHSRRHHAVLYHLPGSGAQARGAAYVVTQNSPAGTAPKGAHHTTALVQLAILPLHRAGVYRTVNGAQRTTYG
jgi:hypothetical protein